MLRSIVVGIALVAGCVPPTPAEPPAGSGSETSSGVARRLRLAVVQLASENGAREANLAAATPWIERASADGAQLVVLPEFMPTGYSLDFDAWDAAEPRGGPTERWLTAQASRLGMHVGTSYLEADGDDFYNTFALAEPGGRIAGRVRKSAPAGLEGRLFRGDPGPRVIETSLGRIGVGICQESYRCMLAPSVHEAGAEVLLLPHSYPDLSESGGLEAPPGRFVAQFYARELGIPVAMVNKVGQWRTRIPEVETTITGEFPGESAIADTDGEVVAELDGRAGFAVAEVWLDPERRRVPSVSCTGPFVDALTLGGPLRRFFTRMQIRAVQIFGLDTLESRSIRIYDQHPERAARARAAAGSTSPRRDSR